MGKTSLTLTPKKKALVSHPQSQFFMDNKLGSLYKNPAKELALRTRDQIVTNDSLQKVLI